MELHLLNFYLFLRKCVFGSDWLAVLINLFFCIKRLVHHFFLVEILAQFYFVPFFLLTIWLIFVRIFWLFTILWTSSCLFEKLQVYTFVIYSTFISVYFIDNYLASSCLTFILNLWLIIIILIYFGNSFTNYIIILVNL